MNSTFGSELAAVFRREGPAVTAALVRMSRDFDAAEDALQDAFIIAATRWTTAGVPENPGGWIMTTAKRCLIDKHRRSNAGESKERLALDLSEPRALADDRLSLMFTCCHPALNLENRVALTLRTICGLRTEEVAAAFVVPTETMAKRLVRAKRKIKVARIAYEVPDSEHWEPRLASVLATVYLAFNRGYDLGTVDRRGVELCGHGIELGRLLNFLIPTEPEIEGLLALMLFTQARAATRFDDRGEKVLLRDQDRRLWDKALLDEARRLVAAAPRHGSVGQYWIQAAIAAEHTAPIAPNKEALKTIVALYDKLLIQTGHSPVVQLNRALAVAEQAGPQAGLDLLAGLDAQLGGYALLHAARAELHYRADQIDLAQIDYGKAIELTPAGPQHESLRRALKEIS